MKTSSLFAAVALAVSALASTARAAPITNLVTNGDFNSGVYTSNTQFGTSYTQTNQQGVTGWTGNNGYDLWFSSAAASSTVNAKGQYFSTGNEKLYGPVPASPGGGSFIGLDGEQTNGVQGAISQTIAGLTVGTMYKLTFDWAAGQVQSRTGITTEKLQVGFGNQALTFGANSGFVGQTYTTGTVTNPSGGFTGWFSEGITFTATSTSQVLSFLSVGTPTGLPPIALLDDVQLQVPEPMSLALLGVGLVGLGVARRRRKA